MKFKARERFVEAIVYNGDNIDDVVNLIKGDGVDISIENDILSVACTTNWRRMYLPSYKDRYFVKFSDGDFETMHQDDFNARFEAYEQPD